MADWLREQRQPTRVIERFWRQILVSAINEELDRMAARHGFQVFGLGFLARTWSYEMGVPAVPLGELYRLENFRRWPNVRVFLRRTISRVGAGVVEVDGKAVKADYCVLAVPWHRAAAVAAGVEVPAMETSPITGIHLWFDRPVTDLPHATLLDRNMQWMFNKGGGRQIQLVVSASRSLVAMRKAEIVELAMRELVELFPRAGEARLLQAHVVKEVYATYSAGCGLRRPGVESADARLVVAGDWISSGWPATMEGAVRSGYMAAEAVTRAAGTPGRFLLPDLA